MRRQYSNAKSSPDYLHRIAICHHDKGVKLFASPSMGGASEAIFSSVMATSVHVPAAAESPPILPKYGVLSASY
ncbi:hypothetical protein VTG60DRAFT_5808 [Thermothelomyces hinnuleus]